LEFSLFFITQYMKNMEGTNSNQSNGFFKNYETCKLFYIQVIYYFTRRRTK